MSNKGFSVVLGLLTSTKKMLACLALVLGSSSILAIPSTAVQHHIVFDYIDKSVDIPLPHYGDHGSITRYQEQIQAIEDFDGVYDQALIGELIGLGMAHQKQDSSAEASQAFARALHLQRINQGLQSPEQIPILERLISNYSAAENWLEVASRQEQLYALQRRIYPKNDPRLLPTIKTIVQRYIQAAEGRFSSETVMGLQRAVRMMDKAETIVEENYGAFDPRLLEVLYGQAILQYHLELYRIMLIGLSRPGEDDVANVQTTTFGQRRRENQRQELVIKPYELGRRALQRRVNIIQRLPDANFKTQILGDLAFADWYLLFGKRQTARVLYQRIYQKHNENNEALAFIDTLLSTPRPLKFSYELEPETIDSGTPFVEATFDVTTAGSPRRIEITESHKDEKKAATLRKKIRTYRFRPRFESARPVATRGVRYREATTFDDVLDPTTSESATTEASEPRDSS